MIRAVLLVLGLVLVIVEPAACQTACPETKAMQDLLAEVHQLRQDLQTVALAARRAQILIYRLYLQQALVEKASQNLENTKQMLVQLQSQKEYEAVRLKRYEEMRDAAENAEQRKQLEDSIAELRIQREAATAMEQELQTKNIDLEEQLRSERAKLEEEQAELDRLDKALESTVLQAVKR